MASDTESVVEWIPCEPGKKKRLYIAQGDEEDAFTLMRTGAQGFDGLGRSPLFDAIYMCFADFRRLTPDEKRVYIVKERTRIAESLSPSVALRILLGSPWGYSRLELGIRDAYYRLYHRFDHDPEHGSIPEKEQDVPDFLDQILDELLTNTSPALGRVWLQILSPSYFEKDVVETLRVGRLNGSAPRDASRASSVQAEFSKLVRETVHHRFEKWIQKGKFSLGSAQQERLDQVIQNFTDLFFQSACEWVAFYYKNLLAGHLEEDNPIGRDPIEFLTFFAAFLPFDCILVDASSHRPVFDSMVIRLDLQGQDGQSSIDHNVVPLLVFPPPAPSADRYVFESLGIVSPSTDPDAPSKLSRILPPDHPFIVHLRHGRSVPVESSDDS